MAQQYYPNVVVQQALLKSLDSKNKKVFVVLEKTYGDGINVFEIEKYTVKNAKDDTVFEYQKESLESSFRKSLKIDGTIIKYDTHDTLFNCGPLGDFARFVDKLEYTLKQKLAVQANDEMYKKAKQNMSVKDKFVIEYLNNRLQK
ncbi:MAG: hypothetical protein MJ170_04105 [Alphaproteobacteria bacterium]|nr:hypothetical protein [Alphaproteobacteria bacterium]